MKAWVGLDVGKQGGISAIYEDGIVSAKSFPLIKGKEIDLPALTELFVVVVDNADQVIVGIEDVHSIYNVSAKANFQFGRALGLLEGICSAKSIPFIKVAAGKWQKYCFEGIPVINKTGTAEKGRGSKDTKAMALIAAKRLYPDIDLRKSQRAEKAHEGIVDALLIAHYLKQTQR